jgi:hypothetical protein
LDRFARDTAPGLIPAEIEGQLGLGRAHVASPFFTTAPGRLFGPSASLRWSATICDWRCMMRAWHWRARDPYRRSPGRTASDYSATLYRCAAHRAHGPWHHSHDAGNVLLHFTCSVWPRRHAGRACRRGPGDVHHGGNVNRACYCEVGDGSGISLRPMTLAHALASCQPLGQPLEARSLVSVVMV